MSNSATARTSTTASSTNSASSQVEIVACGALAGHIREIATRRGWRVTVRPLPAALHNRPQRIAGDAKRAIAAARASGAKSVVLAYAECGTYGALDDLATDAGVVAEVVAPQVWAAV